MKKYIVGCSLKVDLKKIYKKIARTLWDEVMEIKALVESQITLICDIFTFILVSFSLSFSVSCLLNLE